MTSNKYIDIHSHTCYQDDEVTLLLNVFPEEKEKLDLPVYMSVGLHPWHISEISLEERIRNVKEAMNQPNVLAVGEAGLDKSVQTDYSLQQKTFTDQLSIAELHHKPMIIHCVRAYSELLGYRKKSDLSLPWIFHWFNADMQIAVHLTSKNCYLSFGHMLFREESKAFRVFKELPLEQVFLETDDAGFTIQEIYARAAAIRNIDLQVLKTQIMDNFARCFHL